MTRPFPIDRRTALGGILAVVAALAMLAATRPPPTTDVLVAAADLAPGIPLREESVVIRTTSDPEGLVAAGDPADYAGWSLAAPLDAGEPIPASLLRPAARRTHPDVLAIALDADHAVLGDLRSGDRIDVFLTAPAGEDGTQATTLVADDVFVVEAAAEAEGIGADDFARLLVAADRDLAAALIKAIRTGEIDLVRVER